MGNMVEAAEALHCRVGEPASGSPTIGNWSRAVNHGLPELLSHHDLQTSIFSFVFTCYIFLDLS